MQNMWWKTKITNQSDHTDMEMSLADKMVDGTKCRKIWEITWQKLQKTWGRRL